MGKNNISEENKSKEYRVKKLEQALDYIDDEKNVDSIAKDWDRDSKKIATTAQRNILKKVFKK